jgi:hypothetical protein
MMRDLVGKTFKCNYVWASGLGRQYNCNATIMKVTPKGFATVDVTNGEYSHSFRAKLKKWSENSTNYSIDYQASGGDVIVQCLQIK